MSPTSPQPQRGPDDMNTNAARLMAEVPDPAERLARAEFRATQAAVRARKDEHRERRAAAPVTLSRVEPRRERVRRLEAAVLGYVAGARRVGERLSEPLPVGSVVMLDGLTGTAYQRMGSDGLYRSAATRAIVDHDYLVERHAVILYAAPGTA